MSAYPLALHNPPTATMAATEALLLSGGDARLALDPATGRNAYGCAPRPDADLLDFASCTASVISAPAYQAADALRRRLGTETQGRRAGLAWSREAERIQGELLQLLGLSDLPGLRARLAPSGTDLHFLARASLAGDGRPLTVLLPEPAETGSGVPAALGQHALRLAHPGKAASDHELCTVPIRTPDGQPRAAAEVDGDFSRRAEAALAAGRSLLVVLLDVSKTGLTAPSPAWALALAGKHPDRVRLLVDACQARLAPATLGAWLEAGAILALTGSKFLGGPSFSGVLLARDETLSYLPATPAKGEGDFGLLLRWQAALVELRAFSALASTDVASCLERFGRGLADRVGCHPSLALLPGQAADRRVLGAPPCWDTHPSIFSLRVGLAEGREGGLDPWQVKRLHALMRQDISALVRGCARDKALAAARVHLGQPVACASSDGTPGAVLRLCLGARQVVAAVEPGGPDALLDQAERILSKLDLAVSAGL